MKVIYKTKAGFARNPIKGKREKERGKGLIPAIKMMYTDAFLNVTCEY